MEGRPAGLHRRVRQRGEHIIPGGGDIQGRQERNERQHIHPVHHLPHHVQQGRQGRLHRVLFPRAANGRGKRGFREKIQDEDKRQPPRRARR